MNSRLSHLPCIFSALILSACGDNSNAATSENCPSSADLDQGVIFEMKGPKGAVINIVRRVSPGIYLKGKYVTPRESKPSSFSRSIEGYFSVAYFSEGKVSETSAYTPEPPALLPLKDKYTYSYKRDDTSRGLTTGTISATTKEGNVSIGNCQYSAIEITENNNFTVASGDSGTSRTIRLYIPKLAYSSMGSFDSLEGFSVRKWQEGDPLVVDFK